MALAGYAIAASAQTPAPAPAPEGNHLGVQNCSGDNCHGRVGRIAGVRVQQNEYLIWKTKEKHSQAYAALKEPRALRIAKNLGLGEPQQTPLCLGCHTDNVAPERRGPQFDVSNGVGCEVCHGGASGWLGTHMAGADHAANVAAGMYPIERPEMRAEKCLNCHLGNTERAMTHRLNGAGHPPLSFELDVFQAMEPPHFIADAAYVQRKGQPNDMQLWAVGQAAEVRRRMELLLDPKNVPKGVAFEQSLFDCQSCHHARRDLQWQARAATGLPPGSIKLYDASIVMLTTIAGRVAPDQAKTLGSHLLALHKATGEGWDAVQREATAVRDTAAALIPVLAAHQFDKADAQALVDAVISAPISAEDLDYSGAQQRVNALEAIVAAMRALGLADQKQLAALDPARAALYAAVADDQKYQPEAFVEALKAFKAKLPPL